MARGKVKKYDDAALVFDIAAQELTRADIAKKHGLSESTVYGIASGAVRPELRARIQAVSDGFLAEARHVGASKATPAMQQLAALAQDKDAPHETRRKAAVDILKFTLGDPGKPETNVTQQAGWTPANVRAYEELPPELQEAIADASGGPTE